MFMKELKKARGKMINKNYKRKTYDIEPTCWLCGKKFKVQVYKKDRKIRTRCYHSYIRKNHFFGWAYRWVGEDLDNTIPVWKNTFWKIVGYTKLQREIIYFFWNLIYGWQKLEYWECPKCLKSWKEDDNTSNES